MEKDLLILGVALAIGLALKLWRSKLVAHYKSLFAYALFSVAAVVVPLIFGWGQFQQAYANWWVATEVVSWIIYVTLVLELYSSIFHQFPALASFGKKLFHTALGISVVVSLIAVFVFAPAANTDKLLEAVLAIRRVVLTSLIIFLTLLLFSISWFRVRLKANTIVHAVVFFVYFLSNAGLIFMLQMMGFKLRETVNLILAALSALSILGWIIGLTRRGEESEVAVGHQWNPEKGELIVKRLAELNATLAKSSGTSSSPPVRSTIQEFIDK